MSQPRFPDPARSRAVLIGASHFTAGPDLPDIPAVEANLAALRQVLTSPDTGVLRPEFCRVLIDPTSADEVGAALSDLAATDTDLLLVYYAGHGLLDDPGRLHLALAHSHPHRVRWTALPFDILREEIANSTAVTRVLVLDCCFSGRAIDTMTDDQGVIGGQLDVAGTYTLTSTSANAPSHAPAGDRFTAFTSALLRALGEANPLTLDQIYVVVDRDLAARNLTRPQRRVVNAAGNLALSRGHSPVAPTEQPDSDTVRFGHIPQLATIGWQKILLPPILGFIILFVVLAILLDFFEFETVVIVLFFALYMLALPLVAIVSKWTEWAEGCYELVVDRSGLTVRWKRTRTHLPWQDITQVGVLRPGGHDKGAYALVVRLRPEVPAPSVGGVLSDEHRQLGYVGLCTLKGIGSSRQEMTSALERFAGGKLLHSPRQFLDRDPRLRPDMV